MRRVLVAAVAVVAVGVLAASASAGKKMEASGTQAYQLVFTCDPTGSTEPACRTADGNVFVTVANTGERTGTFEGSHLFIGTVTVFKNGDFVYHGKVT